MVIEKRQVIAPFRQSARVEVRTVHLPTSAVDVLQQYPGYVHLDGYATLALTTPPGPVKVVQQYPGYVHLEGSPSHSTSIEPSWPPCCPPGPTTLRSRKELRQAFYTLMNSGPEDDLLAEHYGSAEEAANRYLQQGLESAQFHLIEKVDPMRWIARSPAIRWDFDRIGHYMRLPCNFLRLAGDDYFSALIDRSDRPWGIHLNRGARARNRYRFSRLYYLRNDRLYVVRGVRPPHGLQLEYHFRHPFLNTDDPDDDCGFIDFEIPDRWLIIAFAGWHAIHDHWPAGGASMTEKVASNLNHWKTEIARRQRRTRQPKQVWGTDHLGPNLLLGRRYG